MSETAARPASPAPVGTNLENLYKPVGIAALNAATLCKGTAATVKKSGK